MTRNIYGNPRKNSYPKPDEDGDVVMGRRIYGDKVEFNSGTSQGEGKARNRYVRNTDVEFGDGVTVNQNLSIGGRVIRGDAYNRDGVNYTEDEYNNL